MYGRVDVVALVAVVAVFIGLRVGYWLISFAVKWLWSKLSGK